MTADLIDHVEKADVANGPGHRTRWQRAVRGRESDPVWVRPTLLALLTGTALLYIVGLGASGWANSFYSAAVQAGATSWKAFFFGSFDSSNFITVDKPPASLWVMELSARLFGVNTWSILVPQALEGVAAVGLLYGTVRRRFGASAGLIAGLVLATTPVATLMFRFNNPDALLVLLLVGAAYAVTRALENANTRWLVFAGVLVGFGFITKMLQAFLIVPGFGLIYLAYAKTSIKRRVAQLLAALAGIVVGAGWWVVAVTLTPAADRPYVGGSTTNSILQLAFGYNGFGRLTGNETGSVGGGGGGGTSMWGKTGLTRMFSSEFGGQVSWLLPAALLLVLASLWALRRRTDESSGQRAQVLLWASWLVVTGFVFSLSKGIIHPYYSVALAPAIGALVGIGGVVLWRIRGVLWARIAMATTLLVTVWWSHHLLERSASWHPWLRTAILIAGVTVAAAMLIPPTRLRRPLIVGRAIAAGALVVAVAGPTAYSLKTASVVHTGAIPSAGPAVAGSGFGPGGGGRPGGFGALRGFPGGGTGPTGTPPSFGGSTNRLGGGPGGFPGGAFPGGGAVGPQGAGGGGAGGLLNSGTVSSTLTTALKTNASSYTWVAATVGAETASGYQLAADEPVMAIGGFNGTDNSPTLAQFQAYVAAGAIHYFIGGGGGGGFGGPGAGSSTSSSSAIASWVAANYTSSTIGGTTVYDLTSATTSAAASSGT